MTSTNAAVEFETGGTVGLYTATLPVLSPGEELLTDPEWAQKLARALKESEHGEGTSWQEFKAELTAESNQESQG